MAEVCGRAYELTAEEEKILAFSGRPWLQVFLFRLLLPSTTFPFAHTVRMISRCWASPRLLRGMSSRRPTHPSHPAIETIVLGSLGVPHTYGAAYLGLHATGLCRQTLHPLFTELGSIHASHTPPISGRATLLDFTGHGASPKRPVSQASWDWTTEDVQAVVAAQFPGSERPIAVGHSMGAASAILTELAYPGTFASIVAFEPVLPDPQPADLLELGAPAPPNALSEGAARRKRSWPSLATADAYFISKPMYARWRRDALEGFYAGGLVSHADGSVTLACDPPFESLCYRGLHTAFLRLGEVCCPVTIVAGSIPSGMGPFGVSVEHYTAAVKALPRGRLVVLEGAGHFLVQEAPAACARIVADAGEWAAAKGGSSSSSRSDSSRNVGAQAQAGGTGQHDERPRL